MVLLMASEAASRALRQRGGKPLPSFMLFSVWVFVCLLCWCWGLIPGPCVSFVLYCFVFVVVFIFVFYLFFSLQLLLPVSFRGAALLSHHPCWGELLAFEWPMLLWVTLKGSMTDPHPPALCLLCGVLKLYMKSRTRCLLGPVTSFLLTL